MSLKNFPKRVNNLFDTFQSQPLYFVLGLVILNLAFKGYNIAEASLWLDEALHIFHSQKPVKDIVKYSLENPNPPFYNILLHFWMKFFGISEVGTRYLSVLLSTITAVSIFLFARKHINIQSAVFGSIIFSFSDIQLYYSHEARVYALVSLFTVLSFYFFLDLLKKPTRLNFAKYTIVNTLLLYTHFVPVFALVVQFFWALIYYRSNKAGFKHYFFANCSTVILFLPWLLLLDYKSGKVSSWLKAPDYKDLEQLFVRYFNNSESVLYLFIGFAIITGLYLLFISMQKKQPLNYKPLVLLGLWSLLPVAINIVVSHAVVPVFLPRYLLFITPGLFLLMGYLISVYRISPVFKIIALLPLLFFFWKQINFNPYKGEDWRKAVSVVSTLQNANTVIIGCASYQYTSFGYYYDKEAYKDYNNTISRLTKQGVHFTDGPGIFQDVNIDEFSDAILILSHAELKDPKGELQKYLSGQMHMKQHYEIDGIAIYHFTRSSIEKRAEFFVDFELRDDAPNTDEIIKSKVAYSGSYVSFVDSSRKYSGGLEKTMQQIDYLMSDEIKISAKVFPKKIGQKTFLVCSIDDRHGKQVFWTGQPLTTGLNLNEWTNVSMSFPLPDKLNSSDIFKIYIWNSLKESEAYIDDIHVHFAKNEGTLSSQVTLK